MQEEIQASSCEKESAVASQEETIEQVKRVNERFYRAFESLDISKMAAVWIQAERAKCVHPGWSLLSGWEAIGQETQRIPMVQAFLFVFASATLMFAFILGTSPVFFTVAYLATRLGARLEAGFMRVVAVVVLVLGLVAIDSGLTLLGSPYSDDNARRLMERGCRLLILEAIATNSAYYSEEYLRRGEMYSPVSFEYLRSMNKKVRERNDEYRRERGQVPVKRFMESNVKMYGIA